MTNIRLFEHWNILFKDILRITKKVKVEGEGEAKEINQEQFQDLLDSQKVLNNEIQLVLRIYYHQISDSDAQDDPFNDNGFMQVGSGALVNQSKYPFKNSEGMRNRFSSRYHNSAAGGVGMDLFGDLRIGEKAIKAY